MNNILLTIAELTIKNTKKLRTNKGTNVLSKRDKAYNQLILDFNKDLAKLSIIIKESENKNE